MEVVTRRARSWPSPADGEHAHLVSTGATATAVATGGSFRQQRRGLALLLQRPQVAPGHCGANGVGVAQHALRVLEDTRPAADQPARNAGGFRVGEGAHQHDEAAEREEKSEQQEQQRDGFGRGHVSVGITGRLQVRGKEHLHLGDGSPRRMEAGLGAISHWNAWNCMEVSLR